MASKNRPEMMAKVKRISFITDFITYMLGADHICDYSLAARSGMFDFKEKDMVERSGGFCRA